VIPRHQIVIFSLLLLASVVMGGVLWHLRDRGIDSAPTQAPEIAPAEQATLMVASDADNTVTERELALPLPQNPEARARAVLGKLLDFYAAADAAHPVQGGAKSVIEVFLLPERRVDAGRAAGGSSAESGGVGGPQLAVVDLAGSFVASHPSGFETESLTILSICATLHANFPDVAQVRFLVDGETRATLAGHLDLTRTYLTADTAPREGVH